MKPFDQVLQRDIQSIRFVGCLLADRAFVMATPINLEGIFLALARTKGV